VSTDPLPIDDWVPLAIDIMLNERVTFEHAALTLSHAFETHDEAARYMRRKSWRDAYDRQSRIFYESQGTTDAATKSRLVGEMLADARALRLAGRFKEANEATANAAKLLGYNTPDTNINLFQDLSGAEIERLRDALAKRREAASSKPN